MGPDSGGAADNGTFGDPEVAWKTLALVNDWLRHSEAKAAACLAVDGVMAGLLYSLAHQEGDTRWGLTVTVATTAIALFASGVCCAFALVPRTWSAGGQATTTFHHHINLNYPNPMDQRVLPRLWEGLPTAPLQHLRELDETESRAGLAAYQQDLLSLTRSPDRVISELGTHIWANSRIAGVKYLWVGYATIAALAAAAALVVTAFVAAAHS